ncbi:MAG: site-specific integrase [Gammaproteobacteria bacterium]
MRTEHAYIDWVRRFILFYGKRHPTEMGGEVEAFLTHLAVKGNVASSTQNQALNAIVFLYRRVLKKEFRLVGGCRARQETSQAAGRVHARRRERSWRAWMGSDE